MKSKLRFCIWLPMIILLLSLSLDKFGASERTRLVRDNVGRYGYREDLPSYYAVARYIDYGANAPAWVLSRQMQFVFPTSSSLSCCGFIDGVQDWAYYILLIGMWFSIGSMVDKAFDKRCADTPVTTTWLRRTGRVASALYGVFLAYSAIILYQPPWDYPRWIVIPVAIWSSVLIFESIYPFSFRRMVGWRRAVGAWTALAGVFYLEAGVQLYRYREPLGSWTVALLFIWGCLCLTGSIYLFKRTTDPVTPTQQSVA